MKTSIFIPLLLITSLSFVLPIRGQVAIGSVNKPNHGALLDLKQEEGAAVTL